MQLIKQKDTFFLKTRLISIVLCLMLFSGLAHAEIKVLMETSMGNMTFTLDDKKAPLSVENFLEYVDKDFYNGTIFHRVISGFMIQGGGFTKSMNKKKTRLPVINESYNGLSNDYGTIAMARTSEINSATSQFFINHKNNIFLNAQGSKAGYAVFGKIIEGMEVLERIAATPTGSFKGYRDVPLERVLIKKVSILEEGEKGGSKKREKQTTQLK